jgi:hypothetical protein
MHICINLVGHPKYCVILNQQLKHFVMNNTDTFHCLYTTWTHVDEEHIVEQIPNVHVKKYIQPTMENEEFKWFSETYEMDYTNVHKTGFNYFYTIFIRKISILHILEYENQNGITFDVIITIRPDTKFYPGSLPIHSYYHLLKEKQVYVNKQITFDVFNEGSISDILFMAKRNTMMLFLNPLPFIESCVISNTKVIHPETFMYKWTSIYFDICYTKATTFINHLNCTVPIPIHIDNV